jgi:hypothetical protein
MIKSSPVLAVHPMSLTATRYMYHRSPPVSSLSARGQICVRCELECPVTNGEKERLEVGILRWGDSKKLRDWLDDRACSMTVAVKRVYCTKRWCFKLLTLLYRTHMQ